MNVSEKRVIAGYDVVDTIGSGNWGTVYKVVDTEGNIFALKETNPTELARAQMEKRGI